MEITNSEGRDGMLRFLSAARCNACKDHKLKCCAEPDDDRCTSCAAADRPCFYLRAVTVSGPKQLWRLQSSISTGLCLDSIVKSTYVQYGGESAVSESQETSQDVQSIRPSSEHEDSKQTLQQVGKRKSTNDPLCAQETRETRDANTGNDRGAKILKREPDKVPSNMLTASTDRVLGLESNSNKQEANVVPTRENPSQRSRDTHINQTTAGMKLESPIIHIDLTNESNEQEPVVSLASASRLQSSIQPEDSTNESTMVDLSTNEGFKCEVLRCQKSFENESDLARHILTVHLNKAPGAHEVDRPYICPLCEHCTAFRSDLNNHMMLLHGWDGTQVSFGRHEMLPISREHSSTDINYERVQGPLGVNEVVPVSGEILPSSVPSGPSHVGLDADFKPYACSMCPHRTKWPYRLISHLESAHNFRKVRGPSGRWEALPPLPPSIGETRIAKQYACADCDYRVNRRDHMVQHRLRKHRLPEPSGPFPGASVAAESFTCLTCGYITSQKDDMAKHKRGHHNFLEPPGHSSVAPVPVERLTCPSCGYTTNQKDDMDKHKMRDHPFPPGRSSVAPVALACPNCRYSTDQKDDMAEHKLRYHGLLEPPERPWRVQHSSGRHLCSLCGLRTEEKERWYQHMVFSHAWKIVPKASGFCELESGGPV